MVARNDDADRDCRLWFILGMIVGILVTLYITALMSAVRVRAADNGQWASADPAIRDWYRAQVINDPAIARMHLQFKSCCDHADVVHTQFRVGVKGDDVWEYLLPDGTWKAIADDIIHWGERAPDGRATLFVYHGLETCFYPPDGGI